MKKALITGLLATCVGVVQAQQKVYKTAPVEVGKHDGYGWAVAMDSAHAVVSAARADGAGPDQGAVWVYETGTNGLANGQRLNQPRNQAFAHYGNDVAIQGPHLLVSAPGASDKGAHAGAVYYYRLNNAGNWTLVQTLYASVPHKNDHFGHSVALSGDVAVIGAPGIQSKHHHGNAYVFRLKNGIWQQEQVITPRKVSEKSAFGWDVTVHGSVLAVSDAYATTTALQSGLVDVYAYNGTNWAFDATLKPEDANGNELYGGSISLYEQTLAVGAAKAQGVALNTAQRPVTGAVYTYKRINGNWRPAGKLTGDAASNNHDLFGGVVTLYQQALVVGCSQDDFMAKNAGAAYVFLYKGNAWQQVNKFLPTDGAANDYYGSAVAVYGKNILVGARLGEDDTARADHGNVYFHANIDIPLAIDEVEEQAGLSSRVGVYPNPLAAQSRVVINTRSVIEVVSVYDMTGRLVEVLHGWTATGNDEYTLELQAPKQSGIYLVNVKLSEGTYHVRVVNP